MQFKKGNGLKRRYNSKSKSRECAKKKKRRSSENP